MEENRPVRPTDFLNPRTEYATAAIAKNRFAICKKCPNLTRVTNQCTLCGCFMKLKVKLADAECPENRWGSS